jgi:hypothetical protein
MNRRIALAVTTVALLGAAALSAGAAMGQQSSLKEQLVGEWLGSINATLLSDSLKLSADGQYEFFTMVARQASGGFCPSTDIGTWSVNEADKIVTLSDKGKYSVTLSGEEQTLTDVNTNRVAFKKENSRGPLSPP